LRRENFCVLFVDFSEKFVNELFKKSKKTFLREIRKNLNKTGCLKNSCARGIDKILAILIYSKLGEKRAKNIIFNFFIESSKSEKKTKNKTKCRKFQIQLLETVWNNTG